MAHYSPKESEESDEEYTDAAIIDCPDRQERVQVQTHHSAERGETREKSTTHQIGRYHEQIQEITQMTNTTNEKGETSSSTQIRTTKWLDREGQEYKKTITERCKIDTHSSTFQSRAVYYEETTNEGRKTKKRAIESWVGYKQMVELCRIVPDQGTNLNPGQLPFKKGLVDIQGDLLYDNGQLGGIPQKVLEEIKRFHKFCEIAQPDTEWKQSNDTFVATYASALITTPMYMRAVYQGRYFDVMVDLGAAVSLFANKDLFPGT
jgi:hypothetical protein